MRNDVNVFTVAGLLGRDMEIKYFADGNPVGRFSIANQTYTGSDAGPVWFDCEWKSKRVEAVQHLMTTGRKVTVTGKMLAYKTEGMSAPKYYLRVSDIDIGEESARSKQGDVSHPRGSQNAQPVPSQSMQGTAGRAGNAPAQQPQRYSPPGQARASAEARPVLPASSSGQGSGDDDWPFKVD